LGQPRSVESFGRHDKDGIVATSGSVEFSADRLVLRPNGGLEILSGVRKHSIAQRARDEQFSALSIHCRSCQAKV
jgi:hypothetical protein